MYLLIQHFSVDWTLWREHFKWKVRSLKYKTADILIPALYLLSLSIYIYIYMRNKVDTISSGLWEIILDTMSDPAKEQDMGINNRLIHQKPPVVQYDTRSPTWKEMQEVVRATRSASAPGPSRVPYIVYKRCKGVLQILWKILRVIWRRGKIVEQWRFAEGVWIPKEEGSKLLDQFRLISWLNTESQIFFSLLSRWLSDFFLGNGYIDRSVQKGGVAGMPGCLEHTVLTQLLREAKESKGDLTVLWLDLANAYGSMPHKLVEEALKRHHVPPSVCDLIADYYKNFRLRACSSSVTSQWQTLEKGIITGCTMFAVLFSFTMNMLVKAAEVECRGPLSRSGVRQSPIRTYMDDLTVTTTSVMGGRWLLKGLERNMTWARKYFKPAKSRSLVLKKGKFMEKVRFTVAEETIPTLSEKPIKSLGKTFNSSLKDTTAKTEEYKRPWGVANEDRQIWIAWSI